LASNVLGEFVQEYFSLIFLMAIFLDSSIALANLSQPDPLQIVTSNFAQKVDHFGDPCQRDTPIQLPHVHSVFSDAIDPMLAVLDALGTCPSLVLRITKYVTLSEK
jgi:hypothetical protein